MSATECRAGTKFFLRNQVGKISYKKDSTLDHIYQITLDWFGLPIFNESCKFWECFGPNHWKKTRAIKTFHSPAVTRGFFERASPFTPTAFKIMTSTARAFNHVQNYPPRVSRIKVDEI